MGNYLIYDMQIIDLTYDLENNMITYSAPWHPKFLIEQLATINKEGRETRKVTFGTHTGTHIDAPRHFSKIGFPVDKIPVTQLIGNAVVINVEKNVENHPDYAITLADIQAFEKQYRSLSPQDIVIFYTGWGQYWRDKKHYLGTDKFGDVKNLHFPGLSPEAARYLVMKKVKGVGLDTPSLDPGISNDFQAHQIILRANLFGVENIAHLGKLPPVGAKLIVAPMKIEGGSGAPTRVFALLQIGAKPLSV